MEHPETPITDPARGLSSALVAERVAEGRTNRVRRSDGAEYLDIVNRNVFTLFNLLVVPAAVMLLVLGDYRPAAFVSGFMFVNTFLGLVQELRAKRILDRLTLLAETRVRVRRDGQVLEVAAGDVVFGDVVLLTAGDPVVADGVVVESRYLEIDEALLTGESDPVARPNGERLLSGSFCVAGEGAYVVDRVGRAAFAQKTASEARSYSYTASPLQAHVELIIRSLTVLAIVLGAAYITEHYAFGDYEKKELLRMVAATITSMVPQGLVLMATLAFLVGAVRMTGRGAIINRLSAVEAMASINTLCMDKTGTLTTNRLQLAGVHALGDSEDVARRKLALFAACSLDQDSKALVAMREALGEARGERLDQLPFKSQNRYSALRVRSEEGEYTLVLGACEALGPLLGDASWEPVWRKLLISGQRLVMLAEVESAPRPAFDGSLEGYRLRAIALVALSDELRPEARGVLTHLAEQDIAFKILSGDNADTVRATIAPLGEGTALPALRALATTPVVSGADLQSASNPDELIQRSCVFGRVSPWQKVEIVKALRQQGRCVAMIGDGVNDVLPIKNAHLGVAMGDGSRASKTVSGVVLQTNDFGLLPELLAEGRLIVRNLRRAAKVFVTKNVYVLLLIVAGLWFFDLKFPFAPQQVTLLNFVTIGVPALLITLDRSKAAASPPGFLREVLGFTGRAGVVLGVAGLAIWLISARVFEDETPMQRSMLLSTLVLLGPAVLWRALIDGEADAARRIVPRGNVLPWVPLAMPLVYLLVMYVPLAAHAVEVEPLDATRWAYAAITATVATVVLFAVDCLVNALRRK